jgi:hypothetical protein
VRPAVAKSPPFTLHTANGATVTGTLTELGEGWAVRLSAEKIVRARGADVISLRRADQPLPPPPGGPQVVLANGSRLPGEVVKIADDRLHFRPTAPVQTDNGKGWNLPLSGVLVIWRRAPAGVGRPEDVLRRLAGAQRKSDHLLLHNGDRIEGTFVGMADGKYRIKGESGKVTEVAETSVAAMAFNTALVSRARPRGVYGHLVLANGARLVVTDARLEEGAAAVRAKLAAGAALEVALDQVAVLDLRQGCAVYLSDLKPASYRHTPFLGVGWPFVADASVANHALRLGGHTFDKGLGMHSQSRLTYDIPQGCGHFEALVGLDEQTGRQGRVRVRVLLDGKAVDIGLDRELTIRDRPVPLRLDLAGKKQLTLVVDFGRFGDVQAHVDWADARFIKN